MQTAGSHTKTCAETGQLPPLSLYVHIPWCVRKCPYCDFNSHAGPDILPESAYVNALLDDLGHDLAQHPDALQGRIISTIFIGGGTPSLFSAEALDTLLCGFKTRLCVDQDAEITLEANPGTIEQGRFAEYRALGINRLSIGVQSFQDDLLEKIGRIHSARDAIRAAEQAHAAGFDNFNLDLMHGLPGQSRSQSQADLRNAIDLEPSHLSWYQLTLEPNTAFFQHPPALPGEDQLADMQIDGQQLLEQSGYRQYEVSAYARPGKQCRHNLNYWQFGDYLGLGAGAHGKLTSSLPQQVIRTRRLRHPRAYLDAAATAMNAQCNPYLSSSVQLEADDLVAEFMLNALRLKQGVEPQLFTRHTGLASAILETSQNQARQAGLMGCDNRLQATDLGWRFLNDLIALFMPENN